jgi:TPR repeat protein
VECITITEGFCFNLGNVIKYIWRAEEKGAPIADLQKAEWYLRREIARRINKENGCPLVAKSVLPYAIDKTDTVEKVGTVLAYAQAGDARRQNQMGLMCYYGDCMPQDYEQAVEWWKKAAEQGNYEAQVSLVNAYRTGTGVEKNQMLANYWLEQARSQRTEEEAQ